MSFNKSVSVLMIASQIGCVSLASAGASAAAPVAVSPEFKMLQSVLALQGQSLSSTEAQQKVSGTVSEYLSTAPQAGQQARLQQAMVDLGVYSDSQAASFVADSQFDDDQRNQSPRQCSPDGRSVLVVRRNECRYFGSDRFGRHSDCVGWRWLSL
jgi:hypothetical protein